MILTSIHLRPGNYIQTIPLSVLEYLVALLVGDIDYTMDSSFQTRTSRSSHAVSESSTVTAPEEMPEPANTYRPTDETTEERRLRKQAVKEEKRVGGRNNTKLYPRFYPFMFRASAY